MATKKNRKQTGLGKGLEALLGQTENEFQQESEVTEKVINLSIDEISPNRNQPRKEFDSKKLNELSNSIKQHGVLHPIIVVERKNPNYYMIIAGERRWRAAKEAGLKKIPSIIRKMEDHLILQHSIIENIQRENLNPVEEARAYQSLINQYNMTQENLAKALGKSRPAITNALRLNKLPEEVLNKLIDGKISAGHARCILALPNTDDQIKASKIISKDGLSVRATEKYINKLLNPVEKKKTDVKKSSAYDLSIKQVETDLSKALGTKVSLKDRSGKGKIEITYANNDELERIRKLFLSWTNQN